ncbi:hypothetical protein M2277_004945 [Paenibacillus sp. LBL]|uniref:hypothetical protein n=1 Tax=Paenibacillus sp. LBL TaxID=2940563 RepID=UPI0024754BC2|nr:hypothetical protein [Paenibacillus sp. LBL]MDH6674253.1 hypothetical protein [Paenibacillus sp. LBL]
MTNDQQSLDKDDLVNITGSLVNFQDSALVLSVVFGLTRGEIENLQVSSVHSGHIDLNDGQGTRSFRPEDQDLGLIQTLRRAGEETEWYTENGLRGTTIVKLIEKGTVFKSGVGLDFDIDNRLRQIGSWLGMKPYLGYDNLRNTGKQLGLF